MSRPAGPDDFLSGASGYVAGRRRSTLARLADMAWDLEAVRRRASLREAAQTWPPTRHVLVLSILRSDVPNLLAEARTELERSRHDVRVETMEVGGGGKFENLNRMLERVPADGHDWLLLIDDDVRLPRRFLDVFLFLIERFDLSMAQPAHRRYSHAAWTVTRRRPGSLVRETAFVEIGPVVALNARTFATLLPFPPLKAGWGLDNHWSALAGQRGWHLGVVDATPVEHALRPVAASYDHGGAVAEARTFLSDRPYVRREEAGRTLVTHRRW
ncbi:MAG TPA: hypothetical protein VG321_06750 [Solirubrobacteraceae bacterium]|nr:hypothetical protein [Solirubrobacteraceae bacterium]